MRLNNGKNEDYDGLKTANETWSVIVTFCYLVTDISTSILPHLCGFLWARILEIDQASAYRVSWKSPTLRYHLIFNEIKYTRT